MRETLLLDACLPCELGKLIEMDVLMLHYGEGALSNLSKVNGQRAIFTVFLTISALTDINVRKKGK